MAEGPGEEEKQLMYYVRGMRPQFAMSGTPTILNFGVITLIWLFVVVTGCSRRIAPPHATPPGHVPAQTRVQSLPTPEATDHPRPPGPLRKSYVEPKIRFSTGSITDVFVDDRNITTFSHREHIYSALSSPDGRYLLVWHMDYPPRKVSIYDLDAKIKLSTFEPGAGGEIRWAANNLIFHQFSAGTNTAIFSVYTVNGKRLWGGFSSGAELCESGMYVLVYPTVSGTKEDILVADIRNGDVLGKARPPDVACVGEHRWLDGQNVRFWYTDTDDAWHSVDIHLRPEEPLPWD